MYVSTLHTVIFALRLLQVAYVHKGSHDNPHYVQTDSPILQKAYLQFESSPEAAVLNKAIDDVAKYDSGFGTYPDSTTVYTQQESEASSGLHSSSLPRSISGIESDECCSVDTNDSAMLSNEPLSMDKMVTDSLDCSTINFSTDVSSRFSSKFEEAPARIYHF
ncbi:hypothetical protein EB796_005915 [Bugula neritina]|uniref:Uncharacterized protein n=1 Tax=Bugula neritina TaxID=10212 RepID=A0A7J7KAV6_BUGNE|nr:hypothetical protein EB796_005915 [Bugula neritina]